VRVDDSKTNGEGRPLGVIAGIVNWDRFQDGILRSTRREYFQGLIEPDIYASSYAWLWKADADTIIGHPLRELYGTRVSADPINLPELVAAAQSREFGMYPEYEFRGVRKNAAFKHCKGPEEGGFGWVVGIGIDNEDIYGTVNELDRVLRTATLAVLGIVVLWTVIIARRTTRPIRELERHTRLVSRGDLEARIPVRSRDELGQLARAFNRMTAELAQNRERLVKAEKDAAWREMARQVAHEIKNPLTPIQISVDLLRRAREDRSPEFDEIFLRTTELIQRQVENMRAIARDFYAFAGAAEPKPEPVDVLALVAEVIELNDAWASELGVRVDTRGPGGTAYADRGELRRVLINLVSNALEAMPDGGTLVFLVRPDTGRVRIEVTDTGHGISEDVREHLFEPYFTTRSHGTGLGLAICRRLVEEMNGEIALEAVEKGGTRAVVLLPEARAA
jgi:signal transduction histidine kinase